MIPSLFKDNANFRYYWLGLVLSQIGSRATTVALLWQVYQISGSTIATGLVGLSQAVAIIVLSPLGGVVADRLDRARLLQTTQSIALGVDIYLIALTLSGHVSPPLIYIGVAITSAAGTFDGPTRQALIGAIVGPDRLVEAFSLTNPLRSLAFLIGPPIGGVLLAAYGPQGAYIFDALTYAALVVLLALMHVPKIPAIHRATIWESFGEGVAFIKGRPIIWQLITLDLSAMVFCAYNALLPALATSVWHASAQEYGILFGLPSAGAILGTLIYLRFSHGETFGRVSLAATLCYGLAAICLGQTTTVFAAMPVALALGCLDALAEIPRQVAVQAETPDEKRGRVTALYQMASNGGPAVGNSLLGSLGAFVGIPLALAMGGSVTVLYTVFMATRSKTVRAYNHAPRVAAARS